MRSGRKIKLPWIISLTALALLATPLPGQESNPEAEALYQLHCAACHGKNMEGAQYSPLIKDAWIYAIDRRRMYNTIMYGITGTDMIAWSTVLSKEQINGLTDYILAKQDTVPGSEAIIPDLLETEHYTLKVETLVSEGFRSSPWSIHFVDDRRALLTERRGGLRWMVDGKLDPQPIEGVPATTQYGDSGMLGMVLDPDYEKNGWVYIGYVHPLGDGSTKDTPAMTRVIRGRVDGHRWVDQEDVFRLPDSLHFAQGTRWGCRLFFDKDGYLYFSIGDIGRNDEVQLISKPGGKLYRINPDGSIPKDNPCVGWMSAIEAIYTIGNRNLQGIDQHPVTGEIWATEHGPMGGDELNIIEKGKNYGWPLISYGINYDGSDVTTMTHLQGMEQPIKYWTPSPALSDLEFYTGDLFPKWKNQALVGALAFEEIKRLELEGDKVVSEEVLFKGIGRIRDINTASDGSIYVVINNPHAVVRLTPLD